MLLARCLANSYHLQIIILIKNDFKTYHFFSSLKHPYLPTIHLLTSETKEPHYLDSSNPYA